MKKILILSIIVILALPTVGQTIRNLQTKTTADSSLWFICDSSRWVSYKKIKLSVITSLEANVRAQRDDSIRTNVGLTANFEYLPDSTSHYMKAADFVSKGLQQTVVNAISLIDDTLYYINNNKNIWERGKVSTAIQPVGGNDTAVGDYSMSINKYNIALANYSFATGAYAVSGYKYSRALSSGKVMSKYGSSQVIEVVAYGSTVGATSDTLLISGNTSITIPTDMMANIEMDVVATQYGGSSGKVGDGMGQQWKYLVSNNAGTSTLVSTADSTTAKRNSGVGVVFSVSVDDATENIIIKATGESNKNYYYVAYIRFTCVGYRNFTLGY